MKNRAAVTTNGRAAFYASMWDDFRQAAMNVGWALGLHGSLASDMDIMAMPWTEKAVPPLEMILELKKCFDNPKKITLQETEMPNNRRVYTLSIWADFYLDINIIKQFQTFKIKGEDLRSAIICDNPYEEPKTKEESDKQRKRAEKWVDESIKKNYVCNRTIRG